MIAAVPTTNGTASKPAEDFPDGFTAIDNRFIDAMQPLSASAVKVYVVLARRGRSCWPSLSRIQKDTGLARSTVVLATAELQAAGYVEISAGIKGRESNTYKLSANPTSPNIELVRKVNWSEIHTPTSTKIGPEQEQVNNNHKGRALRFDAADRKTAAWMFGLITAIDQKARQPNLDQWANEIRLAREADGRTDQEIRSVFTWANSDDFWKSNILSPRKLREKFTTLLARSNGSAGNGHASEPYDDQPQVYAGKRKKQ